MRLQGDVIALVVALPWPLPLLTPNPVDVVLPLGGPVFDAPGTLL